MRLVDPGPVPPFDAAAFVTYDNEQDAAPLASELVEDLPELPTAVGEDEVSAETLPVERPPFRGKGYLRAEAPPETDDTVTELDPEPTDATSSHSGRALDSQLPVGQKPREERAARAETRISSTVAADASVETETAAPGDADVAETDEPSRRKRRRKPRRRRRKPGENPENKGETGTQLTPQSPAHGGPSTSTPSAASIDSDDQAVQPTTNSTTETPTGAADDKTNSEKTTGRRRRRRSRNRGPGPGPGKSDGAS